MGRHRPGVRVRDSNSDHLETREGHSVFKTISAGLASVIVAFVAGASQAQLFIEDFDTFTGWSDGPKTTVASGQYTDT